MLSSSSCFFLPPYVLYLFCTHMHAQSLKPVCSCGKTEVYFNVFLNCFLHFFLRHRVIDFNWTWSLRFFIGWLVSEPLGSTQLCLSALGLQVHASSLPHSWVLRIQMFVPQTLCLPSLLSASSLAYCQVSVYNNGDSANHAQCTEGGSRVEVKMMDLLTIAVNC